MSQSRPVQLRLTLDSNLRPRLYIRPWFRWLDDQPYVVLTLDGLQS